MAFPNLGQGAASTRIGMAGHQKPMHRVQTPTANGPMGRPAVVGVGAGGPGSGSPLMGGGGMHVGPMRTNRGVPMHPKVSRQALLSGLKG
jgi:hypothetical protein